MGGRYGSAIIYVVDKLTRGELRQMGMHRLKSRTVPPGTDRHNPTIGVDCNMVINVVSRFKKNPVASLASFLEEWADHGFVLIPVVDGTSPNSKQATMERIAKGDIERAKHHDHMHIASYVRGRAVRHGRRSHPPSKDQGC